MVKIEKSSDELNRFLCCVYISPEQAASFTGLDKLHHTAKNHFPSVTRKEIRKWVESNLSYHYANPLEESSNETSCMLLKLLVYENLICFSV